MNISTLILCILLAIVVTLIIIKLVRDKNRGRSCCGDCAMCPKSGNCIKK